MLVVQRTSQLCGVRRRAGAFPSPTWTLLTLAARLVQRAIPVAASGAGSSAWARPGDMLLQPMLRRRGLRWAMVASATVMISVSKMEEATSGPLPADRGTGCRYSRTAACSRTDHLGGRGELLEGEYVVGHRIHDVDPVLSYVGWQVRGDHSPCSRCLLGCVPGHRLTEHGGDPAGHHRDGCGLRVDLAAGDRVVGLSALMLRRAMRAMRLNKGCPAAAVICSSAYSSGSPMPVSGVSR